MKYEFSRPSGTRTGAPENHMPDADLYVAHEKLHVHSRTEAVARAIREGLIR